MQRSTTKYNRYHSVKCNTSPTSQLGSYRNRLSLRLQRPASNNTGLTQEGGERGAHHIREYRQKSHSLLAGGQLHSKNRVDIGIGSSDSLIQPNTAGTTLTNVSMTSLIPFQVTNMPKHNVQVRNLKAKWNNVNRDVIYILYEIYNKAKRLRHNLSTHALKQFDVLTDQIVQNFSNNNNSQGLVPNQNRQNVVYFNPLSKFEIK